MSVSIADFWKLATDSRLLAPSDCEQLEAAFAHVKGATEQGNANTLAQWLVAQGSLSRFQSQTLLAGRAGPFIYGEYCVYDRIRTKDGRLGGLFRAVHIGTHHSVLLYFLPKEIGQDPERWPAALQQLAWACYAAHPHVSDVYQLLDLGKFKIAVLENLTGDSLATHLTGNARLAPPDACRLLGQAVTGLARLHQMGQPHGEFRPDNLWLTAEGQVKLLQCPLAPEPLGGPGPIDWTADDPSGKLLQAADYAAPELAHPGRPPDVTTDLYAVGGTLFHMLMGWPPFAGGDIASKLTRHASEPIVALESYGVPTELAQMIGYLMAKDPAQRYQDAGQVADALAYFVDPAQLHAAPPIAPTLASFDAWLQQQSRAPGAAPGEIPTMLQMASYAASHQAGAIQAATDQANAAQATAAPAAAQQAVMYQPPPIEYAGAPPVEPGYHAPEPAAYEAPPAYAENHFGAFDASEKIDPLDFVPAVNHDRPQYADLMSMAPAPRGNQAVADPADAEMFAPPVAREPIHDGTQDFAPALARKRREPTAGAAMTDRAGVTMANAQGGAVATSPRRSKTSSGGQSLPLLVGGGVLVAVLCIGGLIAALSMGHNSDVADITPSNIPAADPSLIKRPPDKNLPVKPPTDVKPTPVDAGGNKPSIKPPPKTKITPPVQSDIIPDDGQTPWVSPTAGQPLELSHVASGAQAILAIRPAAILRRPDGDQLIPALGPWAATAQASLKTATGLELPQIDQAIITWHDTGNGALAPVLLIRASEKIAADGLLAGWGNPAATTVGDETYYAGNPWCYYLPSKDASKVLIIGPAQQIKEIASAGAAAIPALDRHLELMLMSSDADRDVSLVFLPGAVLGDNQTFLMGEMGSLRKPLDTFFAGEAQAAIFSLHLKGDVFIELKVNGPPNKEPSVVASQFATRARVIPDAVEDALNNLSLHKYAKKLLGRFPQQLRVMSDFIRSDVEDDVVVLRSYMPGIAAHNVLLASEIAMAEQPLQAGSGGSTEKKLTIQEMLKKKTSLKFPRDTLEKSLQMLFDDLSVPYELAGGDLQLEGITKNQSFTLDENDKPGDEILRKIMLLANPDGKLIYVVKPKQPGGPDMLFITTRASATKRGDKIPPELQTGPGAKPAPKKKP